MARVVADERRDHCAYGEEGEESSVLPVDPGLPEDAGLEREEEGDGEEDDALNETPKGSDAEVAGPEIIVEDAVLLVDHYEDHRACSSVKRADDICRVPRVALTTHGQSNNEKSDTSGKEERAKPADLLAKGRPRGDAWFLW